MQTINNILVFGATSAICHEVLKLYATKGCKLFLTARNQQQLQAVADDLATRGATISGQDCFDYNDTSSISQTISEASESLGHIDLVLVAHGSLPDQREMELNIDYSVQSIHTNYVSSAAIALAAANYFEQQQVGTLAVISSVAGDRGRKSNYIYGASKGATNALLEGLQGRFANSNISIINIKPGMIDTPMTRSFKKGLLWSTPKAIAPSIYQAINKGTSCLYVPGYWRYIMWIIKLLPATILHRLPI